MGLLKDAVNLGYITLDEYNDLAEEWSSYGYDSRHYGNAEALQNMMQDFLDLGFLDLAEAVFAQFNASVGYYEELYDYNIYYSPASQRWHDVTTGQFVSDPYEWVRD